MARPSGNFPEGLLFATRSFLGGCFGCLGAGSALVIVFVLVSFVFPTQFIALVKTVPVTLAPFVSAVPATPAATPAPPEAVALEVFVTKGDQPTAPRVTQVKLPIQQPLFICVRGPRGAPARFTVRIIYPTGQTAAFGGEFSTDPAGKGLCLGALSDLPDTPGVYRFDAVIGTTVVGSTVLTVVN